MTRWETGDWSREDRRVLDLLRPGGAFLFCAGGAKAPAPALFSPANGYAQPLARPDATRVAQWARRDWIERSASRDGDHPETRRYRLSEAGRGALARAAAAAKVREGDGAAGAAPLRRQHQELGVRQVRDEAGEGATPRRVNFAESPLAWLSRRKGPDGRPLVSAEEVEAGERLRADFEAAQLGPRVGQNWIRFLAVVDEGRVRSGRDGGADGPAGERFAAAMRALGPGLDDTALRVCCFLEGLEQLERRFGWAARSGKVVLKIALARLVEHYGLAVVNERESRIEAWRPSVAGERRAP